MWHRGPFGPWSFKERMFEKGDLKYVILGLLAEKPRHGYEIIRDLEEKLGGFYSPSPGAVYPTLQMLEDMSYVSSRQQDSKRVYEISEEGRAFLVEHKETLDDIQKRMHSRLGPWFDEAEVREFADEMKLFAHDMKDFTKMFAKSRGGRMARPGQARADSRGAEAHP